MSKNSSHINPVTWLQESMLLITKIMKEELQVSVDLTEDGEAVTDNTKRRLIMDSSPARPRPIQHREAAEVSLSQELLQTQSEAAAVSLSQELLAEAADAKAALRLATQEIVSVQKSNAILTDNNANLLLLLEAEEPAKDTP